MRLIFRGFQSGVPALLFALSLVLSSVARADTMDYWVSLVAEVGFNASLGEGVSIRELDQFGVSQDAVDTGLWESPTVEGRTGQASASANLATGELKIFGTHSNNRANAFASFYDLVSFDLPDGMTSAVLRAEMTITGTVDPSTRSNGTSLIFGGTRAFGSGSYSGWTEDIVGTTVFANVLYFENTGAIPIYAAIDAVLQLNDRTPAGPGPLTFDLGNTARIRFVLPEGTTFTSASGVLLSEADTTAIPEPMTLALVGLSLAMIGGVRRIRAGSSQSEFSSPR